MRYFDCHSHFSTKDGLHHATQEDYEQAQRVFKRKRTFETEAQMADGFRTRNVRTILDIYRTWRMTDEDEIELDGDSDSDKRLSMVDEALVAGTIANTNGLLVILAKLVAKGVFDRADLQSFSDSYSKPLDHVGMRENELVSQMQDQMESTLAELMRYLSERERDA